MGDDRKTIAETIAETEQRFMEAVNSLASSFMIELGKSESKLRAEWQKAIARHYEVETDTRLTAHLNSISGQVDKEIADEAKKVIESKVLPIANELRATVNALDNERNKLARAITDTKQELLDVLDDTVKDLRSEWKLEIDDAIRALVNQGGFVGRLARAARAAFLELR